MYKMCHGLLGGNWGECLKQNVERKTRNSNDFKFLIPKGNKDIFRFSLFVGQLMTGISCQVKLFLAKSISSFKNQLKKYIVLSLD